MFGKAVAERAIMEWTMFGRDEGDSDHTHGGEAKEKVEPFSSRIADYWLSISEKDYDRLVDAFAPKNGKLDGTVRALPWSAAFVSYCMQIAGAGNEFPYSSGHATWIVQAIKNKRAKKLNAPLVGYRPGEVEIKLGDIVGAPRGADKNLKYDDAVGKGWFLSHTDIVTEIDKTSGHFYTLGGNVGQSVSRKTYKVDKDGTVSAGSGLMVHIQNNITGTTAISAAAAAKPPKVG